MTKMMSRKEMIEMICRILSRSRQRHKETLTDRQRQPKTDMNRHSQKEIDRDRQGQTETKTDAHTDTHAHTCSEQLFELLTWNGSCMQKTNKTNTMKHMNIYV